jgi:hypothetical protein
MILASSSNLDKSDTLRQCAHNLLAFVEQAAQAGTSLDTVERGILHQVLKMGQVAVDHFLDGLGDGDVGPSLDKGDGTLLYRSAAPQERPLRTLFGEHGFRTFVYSPGCHRKIELRPLDAQLQLPEGKASYLLQEVAQLFCVDQAFGVGARQFEALFGQKLSVDVLEGINRTMGAQAERFLESFPTPPRDQEGALLVATADSKGVPLVHAEAQQVPVFEEKDRPGNRRMATLGCVYTVDPHVRTPEQIVAALFHDPTVAQPADRPEARGKQYQAYFAAPATEGEDAIPSAVRTWTWLAEALTARHRPGQPVIRLMDGQPSLWDAADVCLEDFVEGLRQSSGKGVPVVDILDIIHVSGYVWKAAKALHSHREHQEALVQDRLLRILRGEVTGVVTGLRRMASQRDLQGAALREVTTACNYLEKNASRMRYHEYLQAGYPIASGVIEGACRHVIKDRMERGGMRWTLAGATAMLAVRCVRASGEWEAFHRWRQAEETKRIHPHRALLSQSQELKV